MIPFHRIFPELAQREVRCLHLGQEPGVAPQSALSPDEYAYVEFYCDEPGCDCRRVILQVVGRSQAERVLAYISYGRDRYRLRLRRHYRLFQEELARRGGQAPASPS